MSDEYFGSARLSEADLLLVRDALELRGGYVRVGSSGDRRMAFRRGDATPRERWPEDLEVHLETDRVAVVFHSGSGHEQEDVLALITATLRERGAAIRFESE